MKLFHSLLQLSLLSSLIYAAPVEYHKKETIDKRGGDITITATINGVQVTWLTDIGAAGGNYAPAPTAAANTQSTSTRTHYVTSTVKHKHKRDVTPSAEVEDLNKRDITITATINGVQVTWLTNLGGVAAPAAAAATTTHAAAVAAAAVTTTHAAAKTSAAAIATTAASNKQTTFSSSSSSGISGDLSSFSNPSKEFTDGTIKCSDFPSGQGVISVSWIGYGGWTSLQNQGTGGTNPSSCTDGVLCSYACQAGMSKTQWPSSQPSDGESRGGLLCKNGYLYRTNTASNYLCEWGKNTAKAVSKVNQVISLCRTDYPGSENMNIPTRLEAGGSQPMSVVDEDSYYQWEGKKTSAQYYVNNAGVDVEKGCVWGTAGSGIGNWAPVVLGAGYTGGNTWLSIIPNPNNKVAPNYSVKITADDNSSISGSCSYVNGVYSGGSGSDGCTVSVTKGSASFVFS
ncbi:SUN family protein [Saccharomycopsis crataegensis]|uniref:SUN family protein n=1 Tax=Saccharomycopsis crataegensis TaxID=43959 RepID=A0AAV5QLK3_9ASCO|nr:SUN family protein [Saccharomycopsis crataegensis]